MNVDEFLPHLPEHVRPEFVRAVARERLRADWETSKAELRGFEAGVALQAANCLEENHNHN